MTAWRLAWARLARAADAVARRAGSDSRRARRGLLVVVRAGLGSGQGGERSGACERGDERVCPGPLVIDA